MELFKIIIVSSLLALCSLKSQDYARHLELSLLFYECQRYGPLPKTNRIYWRHDSMVDAGKDVGVDLSGGYYDAGDNVKYNFPASSAMTLLAWSGIEFAEAYKEAGQYEYLLDAVKWGADYFIKCHAAKDVLYIGVGKGDIDHSFWVPPEYIQYSYPSYKVDAENPGSEVAAETASTLAAASILFKEVDSEYSATLLKHAIEIYDFADTYRGDYHKSEPSVQGYYSSYNGYLDELAWGAAWLLRATGDQVYLDKFNDIYNRDWSPYDPYGFLYCSGPISWDDKRPGAYVLIAQLTKDETFMKNAYEYCDKILEKPRTDGGLFYDPGLSTWASNRYAANAASMLAMFANFLPESDPKRKEYIDFVKSQIDYILGDNPAGIDYVVGADENSPKDVHHRGASAIYGAEDFITPSYNIYTLYGALAGGPGKDDSYKDSRSNYQMNEVALDYNAGFTMCLAALLHFGYGVKDGPQDFPRAWPQKAMASDVTIEVSGGSFSVSTGSGLLCSSWCIYFSDSEVVCNVRENGFLDGEGTPQTGKFSGSAPTEVVFQCDGFHVGKPNMNIPEFGHQYKVTLPGGPSNTKPLFEESKCWPSHIC